MKIKIGWMIEHGEESSFCEKIKTVDEIICQIVNEFDWVVTDLKLFDFILENLADIDSSKVSIVEVNDEVGNKDIIRITRHQIF